MVRSLAGHVYTAVFVCGLVLVAGCDLQTEVASVTETNRADHIVINEVFTLPQATLPAFSWIELYNPTSLPVNVKGWTLEFSTQQQVVVRDTAQNVRAFLNEQGTYEVPLDLGFLKLELPPNGFLTLVNDEQRLLTFTEYGPGQGPKIGTGYTVGPPPDTISVDSIRYVFTTLAFGPTDQFVLRDSLRNVIDVVRYGNYTYSGIGSDPYPNNHSVGFIPQYQSLARYAGGYSTGNTSADFYITGTQIPQTRPIPHYFSQVRHP